MYVGRKQDHPTRGALFEYHVHPIHLMSRERFAPIRAGMVKDMAKARSPDSEGSFEWHIGLMSLQT